MDISANMCEKIVKDAQEIKKQLSFIGQNDVDEEVICDLLNTYEGDYTLDLVMDAILDSTSSKTQNTTNCNSDIIKTVKNEQVEPIATMDTNNGNNSVEINLSVEGASIEIGDSSDSDEDDTYYSMPNWEDFSFMDGTSQPSSPLMTPVSTDVSLSVQNTDEPSTTGDIEILEENNNDPNNNLDSIQIIQEQTRNNTSMETESDTAREAPVRCLDSPQPGCSKDIEVAHSNDQSKLQEEAQRICNLLPKLQYRIVYDTLLKNSEAQNRIELTMWDLLPDKRPEPQYSSKRKHVDDDCIIEDQIYRGADTSEVKLIYPDYSNKSICHDSKGHTTQLQKLCNPLNNGMWTTQHKFSSPVLNTSKISFQQHRESSQNATNSSHGIFIENPLLIKNNTSVGKTRILNPPLLSISILHKEQLTGLNGLFRQACNNINTKCNEKRGADGKNVIIKPARLIHTRTVPLTNSNPPTNTCNLNSKSKTYENFTTIDSDVVSNNCKKDETLYSTLNKKTNATHIVVDQTPVIIYEKIEYNSLSTVKSAGCADPPALLTNDIPMQESLDVATSSSTAATSTDLLLKVPPTSSSVTNTMNEHHSVLSHHTEELPSTSVVTCTSSGLINEQQMNTLKLEKPLPSEALYVYDKLTFMFPQVDKAYIRELCTRNFETDKYSDDIGRLNNLTEYLLVDGDKHLQKNEVPEDIPVDEQYSNLLGIFPDADPTYLNKAATDFYGKPDELRAFIQSKLENHDYPTREQYYAKQKITEQQKQYTTEFNVQQFLQIFPDPFSYFEDPKRQSKFDPDAFTFLKSHFRRIKVATLMNYYSRHKHHLSLTADAVEKLEPDVKSARMRAPYTIKDIPLLQEIAFIVHKQEIRQYVNQLKIKEHEEFKALKEINGLLQCQCCYDDECMPSKCSTCDDGHIFCNSCIIKGTETRLANGQTRIPCFTDCSSELSLSVLQNVLPPTKFSIILKKRQEEEVMAAGLEGLVSCPFCHFASIPPVEDRVFKCLNPECMKETCRNCKELNHVPLKCEEAKSQYKARLFLEEKMTEALVRTCYECGRPFYKDDGCNKIQCVCGAMMCYICDKPINGYHHFNETGRTDSNRCPLWTDSRRVNTAAVIKVAEETMKHMKQKDPNIYINTKGLLPQKINTSPDSAFNANAITVRAHKVARFDS